jgi:hypothetical protein
MGPPTVLTNIPGALISEGLESATVEFSGVTISGPFPQSYALLETGGDFNPPNSDVATLFSDHLVDFQSDIFSSPPTFGPPVIALPEDGTFQEFDIGTTLQIFIRSDTTGPDPVTVPEPSTLALFGAGLLGLGALRFRRRAHGNV